VTIEREVLRNQLLALVGESLRPMTTAQIANAQGIKYLIARNKRTGEFKKLTEAEAQLKMGKESEGEVIEVWEERPNVPAFTDLMNRTLGKPAEEVNLAGGVDIRVGWKGEA